MKPKTLLTALREEWTGCTRCGLHERRLESRICFGGGSYNADILLVHDQPGFDDMSSGTPMSSGAENSILTTVLGAAGIPANRTFRTSVVACWPSTTIPATEDEPARLQERSPDKEEIRACYPRLEQIIYAVDPRIIIAMGETAWKTLVSTKNREGCKTIKEAQRKLFVTYISGYTTRLVYPVMATLSIPQVLANPSSAAHGPTVVTADALRRAARYIDYLKTQETA